MFVWCSDLLVLRVVVKASLRNWMVGYHHSPQPDQCFSLTTIISIFSLFISFTVHLAAFVHILYIPCTNFQISRSYLIIQLVGISTVYLWMSSPVGSWSPRSIIGSFVLAVDCHDYCDEENDEVVSRCFPYRSIKAGYISTQLLPVAIRYQARSKIIFSQVWLSNESATALGYAAFTGYLLLLGFYQFPGSISPPETVDVIRCLG